MLHFHQDGTFKIMQIADTQELPSLSPDTLRLLDGALEREKPDLVVFTGDQIQGSDIRFRRKSTLVEQAIDALLSPVVSREIPFMVTFGNHDSQCGLTNDELYEIYAKYPTFVGGTPMAGGAGTTDVQIFNSLKEKPVFNLYLLDSHGKDPHGEGYLPVSQSQVAWYLGERERLKKKCGDYLPSLVFQHIPVQEIYHVLEQVARGTEGAVRSYGWREGEYFVLPEELKEQGGFLGEFPAVPEINTGEFSAMAEMGDVLGIYCGHDHINSFAGQYRGVDLGCTQGAGFHTYGPGRDRGVRMFTIFEEVPLSYETYTVTFDQVCTGEVSSPTREMLYRHMPTSPRQVKAAAVKAGLTTAGIAVGAGVLWGVYQIAKWRRKK